MLTSFTLIDHADWLQPKLAETRPNTGRTSRNMFSNSGRAAISRRITADLNPDDQIIVEMKRKKNTDKEIADFLKSAGRIAYHPKTISTRWRRIRTALAKAKDAELDKGIKNWLLEDVRAMIWYYNLANLRNRTPT